MHALDTCMTSDDQAVSLLRSPWTDSLNRLISFVDQDLLIVSPFVKRSAADRVLAQLDARGLRGSVRVGLITDLRPESALAGSMDLDALTRLSRNLSKFEITHLPSVHAKVYVADSKMAIVTSGNLTESGLHGNVEYGVALLDETLVSQVRADFEAYSSLGARISVEEVTALAAEMEGLKELFKHAQVSVRRQARRAFDQKLESTRIKLLRYRAKGKTTHSIFSETIKFLLAKGPLTTKELHPLIQLLHPDLCDDSIDRVIEGVNFGKRWKHYVRNSQQHLKRHGEIRFDGTRWHLSA
jgi:PLD-like domain